MTTEYEPQEAADKYAAEWPALNAAKEAAMEKGDMKEARKCRQMLSYLSKKYSARHHLGAAEEMLEHKRYGEPQVYLEEGPYTLKELEVIVQQLKELCKTNEQSFLRSLEGMK